MGGARGARAIPPLPLFWVKKKNRRRKKNRQGKRQKNRPPPPTPLAQGLDPLLRLKNLFNYKISKLSESMSNFAIH